MNGEVACTDGLDRFRGKERKQLIRLKGDGAVVGIPFPPLSQGGPSPCLTRRHVCCPCAAREGSEARGICVTCGEKYPVFSFTQQRDTGAKQKRQGRAGRAFETQQTDARPGVLSPSASLRPEAVRHGGRGCGRGRHRISVKAWFCHFLGQVTT